MALPVFEKATRKKAKLRMALTGVSGSGKTLGALYIAYGITGDWGRVALIDTEHERARFYAGRADLGVGEFLYAPLDPPYSPDRYKDFVAAACDTVGPDGVVVVDSLSHAWNNEGGVLEIKNKLSKQQGQTGFSAWDMAGRIQNNLINTILSANCHTIVTMREKMDYTIIENENGKKMPVKVGLAPIQRDDAEYEFDVVLSISRDHTIHASKDTTILDDANGIITPEMGEKLAAWLNDGVDEVITCEDCGTVITPVGTCTARQVAAVSYERFGRRLCAGCTRKANAKKKAGETEPQPPAQTEEPAAEQKPAGRKKANASAN